MGRMTCHLATPQRLEPVGPGCDYGTDVPRGLVVRRQAGVIGTPRRPRLTTLALDRTNLTIRVLTKSGDVGREGADRGSVPNGRCAKCDVLALFAVTNNCTASPAPVRTVCKGQIQSSKIFGQLPTSKKYRVGRSLRSVS